MLIYVNLLTTSINFQFWQLIKILFIVPKWGNKFRTQTHTAIFVVDYNYRLWNYIRRNKRKFQKPENEYKCSHFQSLIFSDIDFNSFLCEYFIVCFCLKSAGTWEIKSWLSVTSFNALYHISLLITEHLTISTFVS